MNQVPACYNHAEEKAVSNCINCGRPICSLCLREYGYFCGNNCKADADRREVREKRLKEREDFDKFEKRVGGVMRFFSRVILPGLLIFLAIFLYYRLTGKEGELLWEFKSPEDEPFSDITLHNGNIYVGCDDGKLYSINKENGDLNWSFQADEGIGSVKPAILNDKLCITSDGESLYAVEAGSGKEVWRKTLEGEVSLAPLALDEGIFYVSNFYRELTDEERESTKRDVFQSFAPFAGYAGVEQKVKTASALYALSPQGDTMWEKELPEEGYVTHIVSRGENFYMAVSGWGEGEYGHKLLSIDPRTGKGKWKAQPKGGSLLGTYPHDKGILLESGENFYLISHDGKEIWRQEKGESLYGKPTIIRERLYFIEGKNSLVSFDLVRGEKLWTAETPLYPSNPISGEGTIFLQGAIEKPLEKGEKREVRKTDPRVPGIDMQEFFGESSESEDSSVKLVPVMSAFDDETGKMLWKKENVGGSAFYNDGKVFVVRSFSSFKLLDQQFAVSNRISALNARKGKLLWDYSQKGIINSTSVDEDVFLFSSFSGSTHIGSIFSASSTKPTDNIIHAVSIKR